MGVIVLLGLVDLIGLGGGCALKKPERQTEFRVVEATPSSPGSCAWFADRSGDVVLFGESAFWFLSRSRGRPDAVLDHPEPAKIGRFDLRTETFLRALDADGSRPGGVWDVVAAEGRIYFTALFGSAGWVDLKRSRVISLEALGPGSNEIAKLPGRQLAITRYGATDQGNGSVLVISAEGHLLREIPLEGDPTWRVAPKSIAYDPVRHWLWINTDLLPRPGDVSREARHDARGIDLTSGQERIRIDHPELQNLVFDPKGRGYWVWADGRRLTLRVTEPDAARRADAGREWLLDTTFAAESDFAQEIRVETDGRAVVTRWSGVLHILDTSGALRTLRLPRPEPVGLYYSGFLRGDRVCATYCSGVRVVCANL